MRRVSFRYTSGELRRDHRYDQLPLDVEIDGSTFLARDWSLGGVRISGIVDFAEEGTELSVKFSGVRSGYLYGGEVSAVVLRKDERSGETALQFQRFHGGSFDALEGLITGRKPRGDTDAIMRIEERADAVAPTSP